MASVLLVFFHLMVIALIVDYGTIFVVSHHKPVVSRAKSRGDGLPPSRAR